MERLGNRKVHGSLGCMSVGKGQELRAQRLVGARCSQARTLVRNLGSIQSSLSLHKGENHASSSTLPLQWKKRRVMRVGEKSMIAKFGKLKNVHLQN